MVGVSLAEHDDGVCGADILKAGDAHLFQPGPHPLKGLQFLFYRRYHFRVDLGLRGKEEVAGHPNGKAIDALSQGLGVVRHRRCGGSRVLGVVARDGLEHKGGVLHRPGHGAAVVLGPAKGHNPHTGSPAHRWP